MGTINGGVVSIEDGTKKPEEYAPARKVKVELRFEVAEGGDADAALNDTATKADAKVRELLGMTAAPKRPPTPKKPPVSSGVTIIPTLNGGEPIQIDLEEVLDNITKKPAADTDLPAADTGVTVFPDKSAIHPAATVTDAELTAAASRRNGETSNPTGIKSLALKFSASGRLSEIPQEKRAEFLIALATVKEMPKK